MSSVLHAPAFRDNYIWLIVDPGHRSAIVVDPGDAAPAQAVLAQHGLTASAVFCTHHHADHSAGIADLVAGTGIPVYGPARETVPGVTRRVAEGDEIQVPGFPQRFRVLDIPGHTAGHIAYFDDERLFSGDTLFSAGCGRVFEGTHDQLFASLEKLAALPDLKVYCGHEYTLANLEFALSIEPHNPLLIDYHQHVGQLRARNEPSLPSSLALERRINPFLRVRNAQFQEAIANRTGRKSDTPAALFATLRRWKDDFKG
ncbi:MAG: hydroxyacylglutathione hydrolase [Acidiferrobacteraceae bacterium]